MAKRKLTIPGLEKIGGINEKISNPGGKPGHIIDLKQSIALRKNLQTEVQPSTSKIDFKEIEKLYPLAFKEWEYEEHYVPPIHLPISGKKFISTNQFYDFFDVRGIMVEIGVDYTRLGYGSPMFAFKVSIFDTDQTVDCGWDGLYRLRQDATLDAFKKAFAILNDELDTITFTAVTDLYQGSEIKGVSELYDNGWLTQLLYNNINLKDKTFKRFSPAMQVLFCIRQGATKIQLELMNKGVECFPDFTPKQLIK